MKKKILIIHGHGGGAMGVGHMRAGIAIEEAARVSPDLEVRMLDMLEYIDSFLERMFDMFYRQTIMNCPKLWAISYYLPDTKWFGKIWSKRQASLDIKHLKKEFVDTIKEFAPDVVICPFWLPLEVISIYREKGIIDPNAFRMCGVITDYYPHRFWIHPNIDRYFVANDLCRTRLIGEGIDATKIRITGIPILKIFTVKDDRNAICAKMGLNPDDFILSILGGGFGAGRIKKIFTKLLGLDLPVQVLVTTGRNKKLKSELEKITAKVRLKNMKAQVFGFIDKIEDLYNISNLIVSKSGGISISEIMSMGCPMVIMDPIPGQEEYNRDYLVQNNAALFARNPKELGKILSSLIREPERLKKLAENVRRIAKPNAAIDIVRESLAVEESS